MIVIRMFWIGVITVGFMALVGAITPKDTLSEVTPVQVEGPQSWND